MQSLVVEKKIGNETKNEEKHNILSSLHYSDLDTIMPET